MLPVQKEPLCGNMIVKTAMFILFLIVSIYNEIKLSDCIVNEIFYSVLF